MLAGIDCRKTKHRGDVVEVTVHYQTVFHHINSTNGNCRISGKMIDLRFLALLQVLLCLVAASPAQRDPGLDDDYALVRDVAQKLRGDRGDVNAQKVQNNAVSDKEETVKEYERPDLSVGQENEKYGDSFPVVVDKFAPDTAKKNGDENKDNPLPFVGKPKVALNLGDPLVDQKSLAQADAKQDGDHAQKENGGEQNIPEEKKDGKTVAEEVKGNESAKDDEISNAEGHDDKEAIAGGDDEKYGSEGGDVNVEEQDEKNNGTLVGFIEIHRTMFRFPPAYEDDGEQEGGQQDPVNGGRESEGNREEFNNIGKEFIDMSTLLRRLTAILLEDIIEAMGNKSAQAEGQNGEDISKNEEVSLKEEELPVDNKEEVANELGSPKKEIMPESGETKPGNDSPNLKFRAEEPESSEEEHVREKRSVGSRIYFPGELRQEEEELRQEEGSSSGESIEPVTDTRHTFGHNFDAEVNLEEEAEGFNVDDGRPRPPPPDLGNDLAVNYPPRDSEVELEINPDAEIFDVGLVSADERTFRSGRRDK